MFLQFTFPNTLPRRLFSCQGGGKKQRSRHVSCRPDLGPELSLFAGAFDLKVIWRYGERRERNGTYRFAVAQNAVHDAEGLPQIWMPRVFQGIKSTTE